MPSIRHGEIRDYAFADRALALRLRAALLALDAVDRGT